MRSMIVVIVLPFTDFFIKQVDVVRDAVLIDQLVELLVVDTVRALDLAIQVRRPWADIDVSDIE